MFNKLNWQLSVFMSLLLLTFACGGEQESTNYETLELIPLERELSVKTNNKKFILGGCHYVDGELKMMVTGPALGIRTEESKKVKGAVLKKGLYLHFVLNDSLHLISHYRNTRTNIPDGKYSISAFVATDFHESFKTEQAFMCRDIEVKNGQLLRSINSTDARLVYGAPWGVFKNKETEYILLDFYLMNTQISPKGNKVRLRIDDKKEFIIDEWNSYYIKGLGPGLHKLSLELLNAGGQLLYGPVKQQISCVVEEE